MKAITKVNNKKLIIDILTMGGIFVILMIYFCRIVYAGDDYMYHNNYARMLFIQDKDSWGIPYPTQAKTYPLYHFITWVVAHLTNYNYELAAAIVMSLSSIASVYIARCIFFEISDKYKNSLWVGYLVGISFIIFETFAGPLTEWRIYARQCAPNPWHNPTIILNRPLGILAILFFIRSLKKICENKLYYIDIVLFSVFCCFATLAKPSFSMVILPGIGLFCLIFILNNIKGRYKNGIVLIGALIPPAIIMIWQLVFVFLNQNQVGNSLRISWGGFSEFTTIEVICVSIATFPTVLATLVVLRKDIKKSESLQVSLLILLIGWLEMFFLTDGGSGNYSWGYDLAVGFATLCSLANIQNFQIKKIERCFIYFMYLGQVITGIYYFVENYRRFGACWF